MIRSKNRVLTILVLCNLVLCDFALTQLQNLHRFSYLGNKCWFHVIWHRQYMASLIFCRKLIESDSTVIISVTCYALILLLYNHAAHLLSSTALTFLTNMNEKYRSASPTVIHIKNQWKTIGTEEKLDVISWL
jgi:hypothetical protein